MWRRGTSRQSGVRLWSAWSQSFPIAGVAAGVAALIIALAITTGMRRDLQDKLLGSLACDLMRVEDDGIRDWQPLLDRLREVPHVTAAAPGIYEQVMVSRGPRAGFALIKGIIPANERTVSSLLDTITSGSAKELNPAAQTDGRLLRPGRNNAPNRLLFSAAIWPIRSVRR